MFSRCDVPHSTGFQTAFFSDTGAGSFKNEMCFLSVILMSHVWTSSTSSHTHVLVPAAAAVVAVALTLMCTDSATHAVWTSQCFSRLVGVLKVFNCKGL
jgi:hypothetical protein